MQGTMLQNPLWTASRQREKSCTTQCAKDRAVAGELVDKHPKRAEKGTSKPTLLQLLASPTDISASKLDGIAVCADRSHSEVVSQSQAAFVSFVDSQLGALHLQAICWQCVVLQVLPATILLQDKEDIKLH